MTTPQERQRILVVDDEDIIRTAVAATLAYVGYAVESVSSGRAALERLETASFDLVVTDNKMPSMTGSELAVIIKSRWPKLRLVMFTGNPLRQPLPCLDGILYKPEDSGRLVPFIQELLARPAA